MWCLTGKIRYVESSEYTLPGTEVFKEEIFDDIS